MSDTETDVQLPEDEVEEVEEVRSLDDWSGTSSDDDSASGVRDPTPEPPKPDITILCGVCERYVNAQDLAAHNMYHNALQLFRLKEPPATMKELLQQREVIIQRVQRMELPEESYLKYVKTINETFQILKRTINPKSYSDDPFIFENNEASNVHGLSFMPRNRLFLSIGMCTSQNKQYRADMEDTIRLIEGFAASAYRSVNRPPNHGFGGHDKYTYIGLFDGYNGRASSDLCREHLHEAILSEMSKVAPDMNGSEVHDALINRLYTRMIDPSGSACEITNIGDVFRLSYSKMDHFLSRGMHETSKVLWSGASALTAVLEMNEKSEDLPVDLEEGKDGDSPVPLGCIHIANCGNVEALAIRTDKSFVLTQRHTLDNKRERERVLETGVKISQNDLIDGIFEATRGLGNHGDQDLKTCVLNLPSVRTFDIDTTMECIILATEGLWQALSYDVVVEIVTRCLPSHDSAVSNRDRAAVNSMMEKYDLSRATPRLPNEDEIVACMDEILDLFEEGGDEDDIDRMYFSSTRNRRVQCSEQGIRDDLWNALPEPYRFRLELAQVISERLVSAALHAQSRSNISVICLVFPGAVPS